MMKSHASVGRLSCKAKVLDRLVQIGLLLVGALQKRGRPRVSGWRTMRWRPGQVLNLSELSLTPGAKGYDAYASWD